MWAFAILLGEGGLCVCGLWEARGLTKRKMVKTEG